MNIVNRVGKEVEFHHLGHTYRMRIQECYHPNLHGKENTSFLLTPEMVCVREDCPECKRAAEERGIPGYRTPAQTCFPLTGDSEAVEVHIRYRLAMGMKKADVEKQIRARLGGDTFAAARLVEALKRVDQGSATRLSNVPNVAA